MEFGEITGYNAPIKSNREKKKKKETKFKSGIDSLPKIWLYDFLGYFFFVKYFGTKRKPTI